MEYSTLTLASSIIDIRSVDRISILCMILCTLDKA